MDDRTHYRVRIITTNGEQQNDPKGDFTLYLVLIGAALLVGFGLYGISLR